MATTIKYKDEKDKSYGLAGMAISMAIWDGEDLIDAIDIDAQPGEAVEFTPDFYFSGNPRVSARSAWNMILKHFQLASGMMIANVMCRSYINDHATSIDRQLKDLMRSMVRDEAREECSLDNDEADMVFDKSFNYLDRVFSHRTVRAVADDFATSIRDRRRMTHAEIVEALRMLAMI